MERWIGMALAGIILCRAVYTDIRYGKIENTLILFGFGSGILVRIWQEGAAGILESLKMAGILFAGLLLLFVMKGLGGGDVKLFCVLAVFFPKEAISIVVAAFFIGAAVAVCKMLYRFVRGRTLLIRNETMNFSVPILLGTGIVLWGVYG